MLPREVNSTVGIKNRSSPMYASDGLTWEDILERARNISAGFESNYTAGNETSSNFEFTLYKIIYPISVILIITIGLAGNSLVIHVLTRHQKLQTPTNLLLMNLAVADILFLIVVAPLLVYTYANSSQWISGGITGSILCKFMYYILFVTVYVTIYSLVFVTIARYITVVCGKTIQKRYIRCSIIGLWCLCLLVNIPIWFSYKVQQYPTAVKCHINSLNTGRRIHITFFLFGYIKPLVAIAGLSQYILHHIKVTCRSSSITSQTSKNRQHQVKKTLFVVVTMFAILWLPFHLDFLVTYFRVFSADTILSKLLTFLASIMSFSNSCINPFIYHVTCTEFQKHFRVALCLSHKGDNKDTFTQSATQMATLGVKTTTTRVQQGVGDTTKLVQMSA